MILEYRLEKYPQGMMTPAWVENGGYFKLGNTFIGWSPSTEEGREYKIPDTVNVLTRDELVARVVTIAPTRPSKNHNNDRVALTQTEIEEMVDTWISSNA